MSLACGSPNQPINQNQNQTKTQGEEKVLTKPRTGREDTRDGCSSLGVLAL